MPLNWDLPRDLEAYIEVHLAHELKYLLVAATTWYVVRSGNDREWPDHLIEMAETSAFAHTRSLREFLQHEGEWAGARSPHVTPALPLCRHYRTPMNKKVLHPDPARPYVPGRQPGDDLPDRVLDLAQEVLGAWDAVAGQPETTDYRGAMIVAREDAVANARHAAERMKSQPVFV